MSQTTQWAVLPMLSNRVMPPASLLLPLPTFNCCYLFFNFLLLLYLPLIAHCTMTAVLTSCQCCAMMLLPLPWCHLLLLVATRWCWFLLMRLLSLLAVPVPSPEPLLLLQLMLLLAHQCHLLLIVIIATSWLFLFAVAVSGTACCAGTKATNVSTNIVAHGYSCFYKHFVRSCSCCHRMLHLHHHQKPPLSLQWCHCCSYNCHCCRSIVDLFTKRASSPPADCQFCSFFNRYCFAVTITMTARCAGTIAIVCCCSVHQFSLHWCNCQATAVSSYNCHCHQMIVTSVAFLNENILFINHSHHLLYWCWQQGHHCFYNNCHH